LIKAAHRLKLGNHSAITDYGLGINWEKQIFKLNTI